MGVVLLAYDQVLDMPVALKVPPEQVIHDTEGLGNLKKEVLRGMALTHSGIVRIYSFEHSADLGAIVMEYVDGETMADCKVREQDNCFNFGQIRPWLEQLCPLLDYAHKEARIAHRDLKPRNILITGDGHVKVTDFGISSSLSDSMSRISVAIDRNGTPPYMSPQQAMGDRPTHLDDIYSLGATLYDLLTSRPPFFRGNILAQVLEKDPPSMAERRQELGITSKEPIPEVWERLVAACLAKNPAARPASGKVILEWFQAPLSLSPSVAQAAGSSAAPSDRAVLTISPPLPEPESRPVIRIGSPRAPLELPKRKRPESHHVASPFPFRRLRDESKTGSTLARWAFGCATAVVAGAIAAGVIDTRAAWIRHLHAAMATPAPVVPAATPPPTTPMPVLGDPRLQAAPGVKSPADLGRSGS
jgi:serine/threonine protein kinase